MRALTADTSPLLGRTSSNPGVFVLTLIGVLFLWASHAAAQTEPVPRPNLVLITTDTTRADHVGAWGWRHAQTPNLDALAARGMRFTRCDATTPLTVPSHATILTGLLPPAHGVRNNGGFTLAQSQRTVAEILDSSGYDTAAVVSASVLRRGYGLDQGFRRYDDDLAAGYSRSTEVEERPADATTDAAVALLADLEPPYFLWVHYFDPHREYRPPAELRRDLSGPSIGYDGEIRFMDREIGRLLEALPATAVILVVGDHGEMLGDHGEATHGLLPFAGARRVPLIVAGGPIPAGREITSLTSLTDVAPTLLGLAGVQTPEGLEGRNLLALPSQARITYWESFYPFYSYGWFPLRALSDGSRLFVFGPEPTLYDLAADGRVSGIAEGDNSTWLQRLSSLLADLGETLTTTPRSTPISASERRALAALGYLAASHSGELGMDLPDPRAHASTAAFLQEAASAPARGTCDAVQAELGKVLAGDPHNPSALLLAGRCQLARGALEEACRLLEEAVSQAPQSAEALVHLASCRQRQQGAAAAVPLLRRAAAIEPGHTAAAATLTLLLRQQEDLAAALGVIDAALATGNRNPRLLFERAMVQAARGKMAQALADLNEAARHDPSNPVILANAAAIAESLELWRDAALLYHKLLRLRPNDGATWLSLAAISIDHLDDCKTARTSLHRAAGLASEASARQAVEARLRELETKCR